MSGDQRDWRRLWKLLPEWAKVLFALTYPIHVFFKWIWSWFGG